MTTDATTTRPLTLFHVIPSFAVGGVPVRLVEVANRLGRGFRHLVLPLDGNAKAAERFRPETDWQLVLMQIDKSKPLANLWQFRRVLARQRPDLMITYNWGSIDWALVNRFLPVCRHIHFEDGFGPDEFGGQKRRRVLARRWGLRGAEQVVVPSRLLEGIAQDIWRLPPRLIAYVPNGVDWRRFQTSPEPGALRLPSGEPLPSGVPVIGTVAPLRPEKNLGRLIRAFARVRRTALLVIVGGGSERDRLEAEARSLGLGERVVFAGPTHHPERMLRRFDLFAMSSETEQMPISILEAMAAELPIASVDVGDVKVMLSEPNRPFVVDKEDEGGLAAAITALIDNPLARARLGQANLAEVRQRFDQEAMFRAHERLYRGETAARAAVPELASERP